MRISLSRLVKVYYNDLDYVGEAHAHKKQYIQIENVQVAKQLVKKYNNIKLVEAHPLYAPELVHWYITLK